MGQAKSKKNQKKAQPKKPLWPWLTAAGVCVAVLAGVLIWALTSGSGSGESGKHHVAITVRDYGTITVELDADAAPITVQNFLDLAGSGFYDGLTFHRIMEGFMIQGGDPEGTGMGGSDKTIKGEFSANGVENPLSHTRGAISMARSSAMDSASSQFFIVQKDSTFLDGQYACFGYVTDGMDVVDAIAADAQPTDGNGTIPADQQPVIESVKVLD
jgi:peptidyl-prolyl cis-trans isomerase B (cyclophilin B)